LESVLHRSWTMSRVVNDSQMPSDVSEHISAFDRFAANAARLVGRAPFFVGCVAVVVLWLPSILVIRDVDAWQLIINTATTIITFLLVALLQNSQQRADLAVQHKLNAIADALADLMDFYEEDDDQDELRAAVGLEERESSSGG
jgi:low affinity Fe/Cu permease